MGLCESEPYYLRKNQMHVATGFKVKCLSVSQKRLLLLFSDMIPVCFNVILTMLRVKI